MDKKTQSKKILGQLVKFGLVGVLNTGVDYAIFWMLTRIPFFAKYTILANVISYGIAMVNSWIWNRRFTFQDTTKPDKGKMIRFVLVNLASLAASTLILELLKSMGWSIELAKLVGIVGSLSVNFIGNKLFVFKDA